MTERRKSPGRLRLALDTNIVVYAEGFGFAPSDAGKTLTARKLLAEAIDEDLILPRQVLAEFQRVLVRKAGLPPRDAAIRVQLWANRAEIVDTNGPVFDEALGLADDHGLRIFDAIVLSAAAVSRCDLLITEDLQDGFVWRGVTVANPFAAEPERRLARLLSDA